MANQICFKQSGSLEGGEILPPLTKKDEDVIMATLAQITPTGCDLQTPRKQARRPRSNTPERPRPSNKAEVSLEVDLIAPKVDCPRGSINPTSDNEEVLVEGRGKGEEAKRARQQIATATAQLQQLINELAPAEQQLPQPTHAPAQKQQPPQPPIAPAHRKSQIPTYQR
jgi:hypothetical protein